MRVAFPTETFEGVNSMVFGHFGSAPGFVIVDTGTLRIEEIKNSDQHHAHGMCQPIMALGGRQVDAIGVAGIGMGALMKLQAQGMKVYRAVQATVLRNVELIREEKLPEFSTEHTCAGHQGGACS